MSTSADLREKRRQRTRGELVAIGSRLFAERGYDMTSVEDIASEALLSHRTFYRYFASKEDLVFADHAEYVAAFRATLLGALDAGLVPALRVAGGALAEELEADRDIWQPRLRLIRVVPSLRARDVLGDEDFAAAIADAVVMARPGRQRFDADMVGAATMGAIRTCVLVWTEEGERPLPELVESALDKLAPLFVD